MDIYRFPYYEMQQGQGMESKGYVFNYFSNQACNT